MKNALVRGVGVAALLSLALAACNKSDAKSGGAAASGKAQKLGSLPLQAVLPASATVGKAIIGDGVMVRGGTLGAMTVAKAKDSAPKTADAMKKEVEMYSPKKLKTEKLSDGWLLSFENKGGMGTNYWVKARREIGGVAYTCDTTGSSAEQQSAVIAACKSLKK